MKAKIPFSLLHCLGFAINRDERVEKNYHPPLFGSKFVYKQGIKLAHFNFNCFNDCTSLIPFMEHTDVNRVLMSS